MTCEICGKSSYEHLDCNECLVARPWETRLAWTLRGILLVSIPFFYLKGQAFFAIFCFFSIVVVVIPAYLAKTSKVNLPVELELILLWFLFTDNIFGRLFAFYENSAWFDKALHLGNSIFIGFASFLVIYVLLYTKNLSIRPFVMGLLIFIISLGFGALWEIFEYFADILFNQGAQGSPVMDALDDTMWDLVLDGIGGVFGGIFGPLYIHYSNRSRCRFSAFTHYISRNEPVR